MDNFGHALFLSFFSKLNVYINAIFPAFMESFSGMAYAFVVLYIIIMAYCLVFNKGPVKDTASAIGCFISWILAIAIFVAMKDDFTQYKDWVVKPVIHTTTNLAGFFINTINGDSTSGSGIEGLFAGLDQLSYKLFEFIQKYDPPGMSWASNAWGYMQAGLLLIALIASYCGAYVVFLVLLILGYFSLYVLFTVGGICIFLGCFSKTRFIFFAWLRAVVNYALVIVFTSIIMSICYFGLHQELTELIALKGSGSLFTSQYLSALCWSVLTFAVLLKGPDFAAALSGGQAGSTSGIAGGVGMVAGAGASVMGFNAMAGQKGALQAGASGLGAMGKAAADSNMGKIVQHALTRPYSASKGIFPNDLK